jgi:hypothetical protein
MTDFCKTCGQPLSNEITIAPIQPHSEAECEAVRFAKRNGFGDEVGGGGAVFLSRYFVDGSHVYITDGDGSGLPTNESFCVCYYPPNWDGEPVPYDVRQDSGKTLREAIEGALAFVPQWQREFPDFAAEFMPPAVAGWEDTSWHNDVCPSFIASRARPENERDSLSVWIDYADPAQREFPQGGRFTAHRMDEVGNLVECLGSTNHWTRILRIVRAWSLIPFAASMGTTDAAARVIQNALGVEHGDRAALIYSGTADNGDEFGQHWLNDLTDDQRRALVRQHVIGECADMDGDEDASREARRDIVSMAAPFGFRICGGGAQPLYLERETLGKAGVRLGNECERFDGQLFDHPDTYAPTWVVSAFDESGSEYDHPRDCERVTLTEAVRIGSDLADALPAVPMTHLELIGRVAGKFADLLFDDIGADRFQRVRLVNADYRPDEGICASHDHCDANMVMEAAMQSVGIETMPSYRAELPDTDSMPEAVLKLWNAAWDAAKAAFLTETDRAKLEAFRDARANAL